MTYNHFPFNVHMRARTHTHTRTHAHTHNTQTHTQPGGADKREIGNFLEEIAMMKKVSSGECCHVVQMVGCVSTALPLALALEFVPFGDLLSYLKYWRQKVKTSCMITCNDCPLIYSIKPNAKLCNIR